MPAPVPKPAARKPKKAKKRERWELEQDEAEAAKAAAAAEQPVAKKRLSLKINIGPRPDEPKPAPQPAPEPVAPEPVAPEPVAPEPVAPEPAVVLAGPGLKALQPTLLAAKPHVCGMTMKDMAPRLSAQDRPCICSDPAHYTLYVACDNCNRGAPDDSDRGWYHPRCLGWTKFPAEEEYVWSCHKCLAKGQRGDVFDWDISEDEEIKGQLKSLLGDVSKFVLRGGPFSGQKATAVFKQIPVKVLPNYPQEIFNLYSHPMDFRTVKMRLLGGYYPDGKCTPTIRAFHSDMMQIFHNCKVLNKQDKPYVRYAKDTQAEYITRMKRVLRELGSSHADDILELAPSPDGRR